MRKKIALLVCISLVQLSLYAQESEARQLDSVIVTAQKREELLKNVPISVSSFSSKQVQQYRIWNTRQLTAIVPNLFSSNSGDNRNVTGIRGITTTSYDQAIATYIDGVSQFGLDTYIAELADIERIEVLRGPQGTLYGRNAMGGVINIITRKPLNRTSGFAELSMGNYQMNRFTAALRTPLMKDKLYLGVGGTYHSRNGYFTNEFSGGSFDKQYNYNGNYWIRYLPSKKWSVDINLKHLANRNDGAFTLIQGMEAALENPFKINQDATATMIDNTLNASVSVSGKHDGFDIHSQTSYQSNYRIYNAPLDGDFSPIDGISIINDYGKDYNRVSVITQEIRISSPSANPTKFNWVTGLYGFILDNPVRQGVHFGEDAEIVGSPEKNFTLINTNSGKGLGLALFGQASYNLTPKFEATLGIRFDHEKKENRVLGEYLPDGASESVNVWPEEKGSANFNAFSPKAGIMYRVNDHANIFLNIARGFRAGGISQLGSDPSQPPLKEYNPEYSTTVELGSKENYFNRKLFINFSTFLTRVNDAQVPTLILPDAITVTRNAGKMDSYGFDAEISANPLRYLHVDYSFGYTHAEFRQLKLSQFGQETDLKGNRQLFTPDITSMFAIDYQTPIALMRGNNGPLEATIRAEWMYIGTQYFDLANQIRQSPYHVLNAKAGIMNKRFQLLFWMRNLTNTRYVDYAYDFGAVHLADPKTFGGTLRFNL